MVTPTSPRQSSERMVGGVALILIGLLALAMQFFPLNELSMLFLPTLGAIFLLWGLLTRTPGLLIPGGIITGIGVGVFLTQRAFPGLEGIDQGGVILLSFAGGWVLITVLCALIGVRCLWPLIPGAIMALVGGALIAGGAGLAVLEWAGKLWPLILIGLGAYWIVWRRRS
jgi:hypothetical protein